MVPAAPEAAALSAAVLEAAAEDAVLVEALGTYALHRWQDRELVSDSQTQNIARQLVDAGAAAIETTSGMPFCSHTCAAAKVAPESKQPLMT